MASLPNWVQGARRRSPLITWYLEGTTTPEDLTDATITGTIKRGGVVRAITGTLTVVDAAAGKFRWDLSAADVADAGRHEVQFDAAFPNDPTPAITFIAQWLIAPRNVVSV